MLRLASRRLCAVTTKKLPNGIELTGSFHAVTGHLISGVARMQDGRVFSGKFDERDGTPLPKSQLEDDGDLYIGDFNKSWQRSGLGEAWLADGTVYKGRFEDDELVEGTVRIPQGTEEIVFEGTLKDEAFVRGTLRQSNFTYVGEFRNNAPHGSGTLTYSSGAVLEGTFREGKLHGEKCKMRLESGFVYIGAFEDGAIVNGELRTPTYTYDGAFNRSGRAHGEGTQIQLVTDPKLIFTGIWVDGQMMQGTVVDEFGTPIDWQNRVDLQQQVKSPDELAMENFATAKITEARQHIRQKDADFAEDADAVRAARGTSPTRSELGYDSGSVSDPEYMATQMRRSTDPSIKDRLSQGAASLGTSTAAVKDAMGDEFDPIVAAKAALSQESGNVLTSENLRRQFENFAASAKAPGGANDAGPRLNIKSNTPWANDRNL